MRHALVGALSDWPLIYAYMLRNGNRNRATPEGRVHEVCHVVVPPRHHINRRLKCASHARGNPI